MRSVSDFVFEQDSFKENFEFKLPRGRDSHGSWQGCLFTVLLFMSLSFYATVQWGKMLEFDDTDVMVSARDSFYDASHV